MNQLVVLVNLIGLFLIDAFLLADIKVTHELPETMHPGTETKVTVTIEKGTLSGFAKLQLDLPPGLSATAIETKGASFTFSDGKAKFIWMSLPASPSFKVSYNLIADPQAAGALQVDGRLSYIEDNERRTFEIAPRVVDLGQASANNTASEQPPSGHVGDEVVSAASAAPAMVAPEASVAVPVPAPSIAASVPDPMPVAAVASPVVVQSGSVTSKRTVTLITEYEMLVEVVVDKGDLRGFGKLQESIPAGFTALEKNSDESIFTAQDRIVKFVWLNLPAKNELTVVYKLRSNERVEGDHSISGEFGYLQNDETRKHSIAATTFSIGPNALAVQNNGTTTKVDTGLNTAQITPPVKVDTTPVTVPKPAPEKPVTAEKPRTTIPAPETGVTYKVQITAAHKEVGSSYFANRHRYTDPFSIERHEGWIKYVTGRFNEYKQARDQRESFIRAGHDFPGPFVTAYNNGERITVQEALMISRQQWIQ